MLKTSWPYIYTALILHATTNVYTHTHQVNHRQCDERCYE